MAATKPTLPSKVTDTNQMFSPEAFFRRHANSPDYAILCQVLTLTLIIKDDHTIQDKDVGKFLTFFGAQYLPYLIRECDNDPLSPYVLWVSTSGAQDSRTAFEVYCDAVFFRTILGGHKGSEFDLKFREFLHKNCQFLLELCKKPAISAPVPAAPLTNLELPLVLIDRALEAKSKSFAPGNAPETKIGTDFKDEACGKLLELLGSVKSVIEVISKTDTKLVSDSLEQSKKKRKDAPE